MSRLPRRPLRPDAWQLRALDDYGELLCLARLANVRRFDYQVETVFKVLRGLRGRALLADEVGLGKTIEAGMLVSELMLRGQARRVLVLTPSSLVGQWAEEFTSKFNLALVTSDAPAFRADAALAWATERPVTIASLHLARSAKHAPLVQAQPWDLVVVDEAHRVKSRASAGFKLVDGIKSRFLLLLTATPVENDLEELYNLITCSSPANWPPPPPSNETSSLGAIRSAQRIESACASFWPR